MAIFEFGEVEWFTDDKGNKIPVYEGLSMEKCIKVREHFKRLQTIVDDYKERFPVGLNIHDIDNYSYTFIVKKGSRKVKLIEVEYDE